MSTYPQYTLKSQDVYKLTLTTLDILPLNMPGAIQSRDLLRVLVLAAATKLSVHQACPSSKARLREPRFWAPWPNSSTTSTRSKAISMNSWRT